MLSNTPINAYHIDTTGGDYTLIVNHEDGSESRIPGDPQNPAQFTDTQGNIYTVDKEGNISKYNAENTAAASAESTQSPSDIFFLINLYDMYHGIRKYDYITHKKETPSPEEIQALKTYYQEKWAISEENTLQALDENFIYTRENLLLENTSVVSLQKDASQMPQVVWIDYREANKKGFRLLVNGEKASNLIFPLKYNNLQTVEIKLQEPGQENSTEYRDLLVWKLPKKGEMDILNQILLCIFVYIKE